MCLLIPLVVALDELVREILYCQQCKINRIVINLRGSEQRLRPLREGPLASVLKNGPSSSLD